jgi:hypothetical protein
LAGGAGVLGLLRVQFLLEHDAELLTQGLQLVQVLLVLALVLDLGLDACVQCVLVSCVGFRSWGERGYFPASGLDSTLEDPDGGGEVVDSPRGTQGGRDDGGRGDEVVGEGVVQVALWC